MKTAKAQNNGPLSLMLVMFALGSWLLWESRLEPRAQVSSTGLDPKAIGPTTRERVNRHMQFTERKAELRSLALEMENIELGASVRDTVSNASSQSPALSNPFESENSAARVYADLEPGAGRYDRPVLPSERVNAMIEQDRWNQRYAEEQNKAFVEAVRANARAEGYELEINDKLEIVKAHRLPNSISTESVDPTARITPLKSGEPKVTN